jgi:phosphoglycolate phosphatase
VGLITHVLFDLDGTLIDSLPGIEWSARMALAECGLAADLSDLRRRIGPPIRDILASVSGASGEVLNRLEAGFRRCYDADGWRMTELRPGVMDLLLRLGRARRRLWLVTNKPSFATGRIIGELGIQGMFEHFLCRDSRTPPFASKAEMLGDLLCSHDIAAANSFLVGDTIEDCRAAASVGLRCMIVPGGYGDGSQAFDAAHCPTVNGWDEILKFCEVE